ncbi:MAG: NADH-quinone oxidoreductase subunit N [Bacteroidetes bacterium]|nr:NADH-quinone oxidoreductase subunit N [Bacteroidota bacterium]
MEVIIIIALTGIAIMMAGALNKPGFSLWIAIAGLMLAFILNFRLWNTNLHLFNDMIVYDNFAVVFNALIIVSSALVFLLFHSHYSPWEKHLDEIAALLIFACTSMMLMTSYGNLVVLFIGIETMSICLYVLAGSRKYELPSNEAALKYFLLGSFATGVMLFGIALIYGASGSFDFHGITSYLTSTGNQTSSMFSIGLLLLTVGLLFKIAAVPFHFWAPDVYEGSPTVITTFMGSTVKIAGVAALYRLYAYHFAAIKPIWATTIMIVSALSFFAAVLMALPQKRFKRLLAYSGISHAGFLLMAVLAMNQYAASALLLYAASYSLATIAAFTVLVEVIEVRWDDELSVFKGMGAKNKFLAFALIVAMLSMAGIPPFSGFMAKFMMFSAVAESGYIVLVVFGVIASAISLVYYLKPITLILSKDESNSTNIKLSWEVIIVLVVTLTLTLIFGIFPGLLTGLL